MTEEAVNGSWLAIPRMPSVPNSWELKEFRSSGVQEFRSSGVQEFRSSGVQEFRSSGVQWRREPKIARRKGRPRSIMTVSPGISIPAPELLNSLNS
jgi:hypothetical protein